MCKALVVTNKNKTGNLKTKQTNKKKGAETTENSQKRKYNWTMKDCKRKAEQIVGLSSTKDTQATSTT